MSFRIKRAGKSITFGVLSIVSIFSIVALSSCNKIADFENDEAILPVEENTKKVLLIHTDRQNAYLKDKYENATSYAVGESEYSRPVKHSYTITGGKSPYTLYLSEKSNYANPLVYETNENQFILTNLKIRTTYYLKVVSENKVIKEDSFITEDEIIRNLYISGVTNARDLGGYKIGDNFTKQGLIFRTGRLNENCTDTVTNKISDKGIQTMLNEMKVKSEIDLRLVSNNEVGCLSEGVGVLGGSVKYYQCPMDFNLSVQEEINVSAVKKVFEILGNSSNYPTFFHCSIGTDRTGYIAWLINACLGVKKEDLYRDYLFSNFGNIGGKRTVNNINNKYVTSIINNTNGATLKEKAVNYLLSLGVKQSQIDTLYSIML